MPTEVREIDTDAGWDEAVPLLAQLWDDADGSFIRGWRGEDNYRLFGCYETDGGDSDTPSDEPLVAVAGVSVQRVLHHERHLWVHDFVVDEPRRGEGFGAELLAWLESWARERDCEHLSLACHGDNDGGRAFYEAQGLEVWGQVMETDL